MRPAAGTYPSAEVRTSASCSTEMPAEGLPRGHASNTKEGEEEEAAKKGEEMRWRRRSLGQDWT